MHLAPNIGPRLCEPQQRLPARYHHLSRLLPVSHGCGPQFRAPFRHPTISKLQFPTSKLFNCNELPALAYPCARGVFPIVCACRAEALAKAGSCPIVPNRRGGCAPFSPFRVLSRRSIAAADPRWRHEISNLQSEMAPPNQRARSAAPYRIPRLDRISPHHENEEGGPAGPPYPICVYLWPSVAKKVFAFQGSTESRPTGNSGTGSLDFRSRAHKI
jgi:hypothetical protein